MALRVIAILSLLVNTAFGYPAIGAYMPVSNVLEHSQINKDVELFVNALKGETPNYALAKEIYTKGGGNSCKSATSQRTLQGFATKDLTGESFADMFYASGEPTNFWDKWFLAGLDGTGAWKDLGSVQRTVSLQKGAMGLVTLYASHELEAAIVKAKQEAGRSDLKSGHAWDEGWAFYYGSDDGTNAPWEVAKKRDGDFPDGSEVKTAIVPYFNAGLIAVRKDTYNEADAIKHMNVIYKMWTVTYMRAALKYLQIAEKTYSAKAHAEGYSYWMAISGMVASKCKDHADAMTNALAITQTSIPAGTFCTTKKLIEECYPQLGISCEMVGTYKDAATKGIQCPDACANTPVTIPSGMAAVAPVEGTLPDDITCKVGTAPAPGGSSNNNDVSSAVLPTVGLITLGLGLFLQM